MEQAEERAATKSAVYQTLPRVLVWKQVFAREVASSPLDGGLGVAAGKGAAIPEWKEGSWSCEKSACLAFPRHAPV